MSTSKEAETWPSTSPNWSLDYLKLLAKNLSEKPLNDVTVEEIVAKSSVFPIEFPLNSVKCKLLSEKVPKAVLEKNANSVYPVVHETVLHLYVQFLSHKRKFGNAEEKQLYENMTIPMLLDRLLKKRPAVFVGPHDRAVLLNGSTNISQWETIGTAEEKPPLTLENYMSYDEVKLSAYLSVSSYTYFLNIGDRDNCGETERIRNKVQDEGIIMGLIGARFERKFQMDYLDCMVTSEQNTHHRGYGQFVVPTLTGIFVNFLGEPCLTFKEQRDWLKNKSKFTEVRPEQFFNHDAFERRIGLSIDTLLIEANQRAKDAGKMAYVHVVGIGLGVWKIAPIQDRIFMDTFYKRIRFLGKVLTNVSDICFAYMRETTCGPYKHGDTIPIEGHPENGITIHISKRQPHEKLKGVHAGKLLVVSYAWDGNALPGNEFWIGSLAASGDPACACSTQVAELHNPHINSKLRGIELRVATLGGNVMPYIEYCMMIGDKKREEQKRKQELK